jgi:hypothetical protein
MRTIVRVEVRGKNLPLREAFSSGHQFCPTFANVLIDLPTQLSLNTTITLSSKQKDLNRSALFYKFYSDA